MRAVRRPQQAILRLLGRQHRRGHVALQGIEAAQGELPTGGDRSLGALGWQLHLEELPWKWRIAVVRMELH